MGDYYAERGLLALLLLPANLQPWDLPVVLRHRLSVLLTRQRPPADSRQESILVLALQEVAPELKVLGVPGRQPLEEVGEEQAAETPALDGDYHERVGNSSSLLVRSSSNSFSRQIWPGNKDSLNSLSKHASPKHGHRPPSEHA